MSYQNSGLSKTPKKAAAPSKRLPFSVPVLLLAKFTAYNTEQSDFAEVLGENFQKLFLLPTTGKE